MNRRRCPRCGQGWMPQSSDDKKRLCPECREQPRGSTVGRAKRVPDKRVRMDVGRGGWRAVCYRCGWRTKLLSMRTEARQQCDNHQCAPGDLQRRREREEAKQRG